MTNKPGQYWINGQYWQEALNMARHTKCKCEVPNCWAKAMIKQYGWKLGWFSEQADKVSTTGKAKVFAVQWLGDIAFLSPGQIYEIFGICCIANHKRRQSELKPHTFLFLTKFPDKLYDVLYVKKNTISYQDRGIYIGISVSNQNNFDDRLKGLKRFPDYLNKWISVEPLYGTILIMPLPTSSKTFVENTKRVFDQVILGGETGGSYKADLDWFRGIRVQCQTYNIPFFLKHIDKEHGRELDKKTHNELIWRK